MIALGFVILFLGGMMYLNGSNINNDMDAQMESIFNEGVVNPGAEAEKVGVLLMVVGFALIIVGAITSANKKNGGQNIPTNQGKNLTNALKCPQCGAIVDPNNKFCAGCGAPLQQPTVDGVVCPHCGGVCREGSRFCTHCGQSITNDI